MSQSIMSAAEEKKFTITHIFKNAQNMKPGREYYGKTEVHHNVPWRIGIRNDTNSLVLGIIRDFAKLECLKTRGADDWSIDTKVELKVNETSQQVENHTFSIISTTNEAGFNPYGRNRMPNGSLKVEFHVTILKMTEIKKKKLRSFDSSERKFTDVVLKVKDQKFNVHKVYLASHSTYFESLLLGNFQESGQSEVELQDIDSDDFQHFLEFIYAESSIEDETIEGILQLADFFDAKTVRSRCVEFLLEKSKKPLKVKFELAINYKFDSLKKKCLSEMKTTSDVISVIPNDVDQFDGKVWKELLLKSHSFGK